MQPNNTVNYLLVEDEYYTAVEVHRQISSIRPNYHMVGWAEDSIAVGELLGKNHVDLIISDIELSDKDVFRVFEAMPNLKSSIPIIFTTGYSDYLAQAKTYRMVDFVMKPVEKTRLKEAIDEYERNYKH